MKKIILLSILFLYGYHFFAQNINISTAKKVARNFYYEKTNIFSTRSFTDIKIKDYYTKTTKNDIPVYYIFNFKEGGFVAVSAHNAALPVPFYSFAGQYSNNEDNPAFRFWIQQYEKQILHAIQNNLQAETKTAEEWQHLIDSKPDELHISKDKSIPPMVISEWDQGIYYNEQCPVDAAGPGGHALTGCVATALGQLLYYYKFPDTGTGSHSYTHPNYGIISADFSNTTYEWSGMQNKLTNSNYPAALLLHHLGVGVDMDYGPSASGMWNHSAAYVLRTYFKYCSETRYIFRDSTTLDWDSLIISNLDNKKPLYYAGWADDTSFTSGHAFVCDGYQSPGYYHFNWGWGGSYDGFFYTNALTPGGNNFNHAQELIVDIYPDTINYFYPENCQNTDTLTYTAGTINDGSHLLDYNNNLNCNFIISPLCGNNLKIFFDRFELANGDTVFISDDIATIDTFTISNPPVLSSDISPTIISSNTGKLYINFKTDSSNIADGWDISYYSNFCNPDVLITDSAGIVADGSESCDYLNSENCRWTIQPPGADSIYLHFTVFDMAPNIYDYILIHKESISAANLIGKFDYTNIPDTLIIPSGTCIVTFKTNSSETAGGWEFSFLAAFNTNIVEKDIPQTMNLLIYPNPFFDNTNIVFYQNKKCVTNIKIRNILGEQVASYNHNSKKGYNRIKLSDITKEIRQGSYFITLSTNTTRTTKKIFCIKE